MIRGMKNLAPLIAFACLAALVVGSAIVLTDKLGLLGLIAVAGVVILGWLFATWWFADDQPAFAPGGDRSGRVTFVTVVKNALHDLIQITRPTWMRVWLNLPFCAVMGVDAVSMLQPDAQQAIWHNPYTATALIVLNLVARYGSTPAHAPVASR